MDHLSDKLMIAPMLSIIVAVYNDWRLLDGCLNAIAREKQARFEVIVVDDGSVESAPEYIRTWGNSFPLMILREPHCGISAARNRGIRASKGSVLLFVDADSRVQPNALAELESVMAASPTDHFFQLKLIGDPATPTGRAEELRLLTLQRHLLEPSGHIRYLNTAAFAIRRGKLEEEDLFDPTALRGEDTLLLAKLIKREELPLFVPDAAVQHTVPSSLIDCLLKDIRSAYLESGTYRAIAASNVTVRMTNRERIGLLISTWQTSRRDSIGKAAWFILMIRQLLQRSVSVICWLCRANPLSNVSAKAVRKV